jgi:hypothetical protein
MKLTEIEDFFDSHEIDISKFRIVSFCPCCDVVDKKLDVTDFILKFEKINDDEK